MSFPYADVINVARGLAKADLVIKNAKIVNVFTEEILEGGIAIKSGYIARIGEIDDVIGDRTNVLDAKGGYLAPSFIDAHIHIESSMITLTQFAKAAVPHGTGGIITDLHEIANVLGEFGIKIILEEARKLPLEVFFMVPSCVPAAEGIDTAGAKIGLREVMKIMDETNAIGLGEMMNYPGVLNLNDEVIGKIDYAHSKRKIVDGHAPLLLGKELQAYIAAGIKTDHESVTEEEAIEKLRYGMYLLAREGSLAKNLSTLIRAILKKEFPLDRVIIISDDKHPDDLEEGHLEPSIRKAIELGVDPIKAIKMVTINPAIAYNLDRIGAIAPGYKANLVILSSLEKVKVDSVFYKGKLVAKEGRLIVDIEDISYPEKALKSVNVKRIPSVEELTVKFDGERAKIHVIGAKDLSLVTEHIIEEVKVEDGKILPKPEKDLLQIVVLERYKGGRRFGVGFIRGFGIKEGAIAQTIAHDSHNIIAVGASLEDIVLAIKELVNMQGGVIVVRNGKVLGKIQLKFAGLMSLESAENVGRELVKLRELVKELGSKLERPFMTLSFMALPVIPKLKITDKGLFDVEKFSFIEVTERV